MQDLINHLVEKTGIAPEKAQHVLSEVAAFIKEKFPMAGGMIDNVLGSSATASTPATSADSGTDILGGLGSKFGL